MSIHSDWITKDFGAFKLRYKPYTLEMRYVFTVASFSRTTTPVVLTQLEYDGIIGYGEASMPPYLGESQESVINFLNKIDLSGFNSPFQTEELLAYVDQISAKNTAAKASVDIALHDLIGKILGQPFYKIWGLNPALIPSTSYTIGIDTEEVIRKKVMEADQFKILKVKLGLETDKMIIDTIRQCTDRPLCADVNQGWKTKEQALEMSHWLAERGVVFWNSRCQKNRSMIMPG
ncbi:hypothetical protein [Sphingobacterium sp. IITKGP-BTPF85]|uniref:hypothetical protein n=1 Tax=Sphingobacterium sp. IITKGP-BTPF85 TaxID=1338009 RepID=UPI00041DE84B|nr:hypothetical protein [Sphingobacterium sp. IITKGP-BTPF85]KKX48929.1 hypothetical protein L950_0218210 [Sphingobacterium sp. IITKGP-BTPF85]